MQLYEKYRPKKLDEIKGQDKAIAKVRKIQSISGLGGKAFWLSGKSGQGKTTLAKCIGAEIADDMFIQEYDAGQLGIGDIRQIVGSWATAGWGKGGRCYIFNEAHGLKRDIVRALLVHLEKQPCHVVVCFTTTTEGQALFEDSQMDSSPLMSRCACIKIASQGLAPVFAQWCKDIAEAEGLGGAAIVRYAKLAKDLGSNCRAMIQAVAMGQMMA